MHIIIRKDKNGKLLWDGELAQAPAIKETIIIPASGDGDEMEYEVLYVNHYPFTLQHTVEVVVNA